MARTALGSERTSSAVGDVLQGTPKKFRALDLGESYLISVLILYTAYIFIDLVVRHIKWCK